MKRAVMAGLVILLLGLVLGSDPSMMPIIA